MPIPKTRAELLEQVTESFSKLREELRRAGPAVADLSCVDDWSVKDLVAVRAWWTNSVVDWVHAWIEGKDPALPAEAYGWNETPRLNNDIAAASTADAYPAILARLEHGFERVVALIHSLDDTRLLEPGHFPSAGKWPVSRWISINTTRQYATARTYVRKAIRNVESGDRR